MLREKKYERRDTAEAPSAGAIATDSFHETTVHHEYALTDSQRVVTGTITCEQRDIFVGKMIWRKKIVRKNRFTHTVQVLVKRYPASAMRYIRKAYFHVNYVFF